LFHVPFKHTYFCFVFRKYLNFEIIYFSIINYFRRKIENNEFDKYIRKKKLTSFELLKAAKTVVVRISSNRNLFIYNNI